MPSTAPERGHYLDDLAYIHDAGFGGIARAAAERLLKLLCEQKIDRGLVVDLGCGSGILAEQVSAAGYDVLGIDISRAMLAIARRRAPRASFRRQSLLDVEIPPCVAVAAVGEGLNYLFDAHNSLRRLAKLFSRIHVELPTGGVFMFDIATPGRIRGVGPQRKFWEGDDWTALVEAEEDRKHRTVVRRITSFRRVGRLYRRGYEEHRQRLFERSEIAPLLRHAGFRVRASRGYGELRFPRGVTAFVATKAPT